ncbi:hypothetical protein COO07_16570 [Bacillus pseudomycoides]|nr:hypothetical protein COO07_16570 [Bacillus pseudomycoides]PEK73417.1 hypothetical protein CN597_29430 [Bacillus pseudomycoides]PEN10131.1 hypothetical protein CN640_09255 [Bacillus pseudomycoides]
MSKMCLNVQFSFFDMVTPNSSLWEEYVVKGSFSSGLNIPISHLLNASGNYYQLRLKNYGGGTIYLDSGQVYYK